VEVVIEEDKTELLFKKDSELLHRRGFDIATIENVLV